MSFVRTYPEIIQRADCGNKAATLARLALAGFRAPAGVGVASGLSASIVGEVESLAPDSAIARLAASDLSAVCADLRASLPVDDLIVRSSAPAEDRSGMPSYGFYESVRCSRDDLESAIRRCLVAAYREPALAYRRRVDLPLLEYPALLIQEFVDGSPSGVGLASDVARGRPDKRLLELAAGPCSLVTSGEATPTAYEQDKLSGEVRIVADGGHFDSAMVERLFALVDAVARTLDFEAEVEMTVADGDPVVLQARELHARTTPARPPIGV